MRTVLLVLFAALFMSRAEAAPRWRRSSSYKSVPVQNAAPATAYMSDMQHTSGGHTGSAQGVAELMASRGVMGHFGGNSGYEGVGMGSSPDEALNNCCYSNSGMAVVDQGVACGRNGRWYACKRYR